MWRAACARPLARSIWSRGAGGWSPLSRSSTAQSARELDEAIDHHRLRRVAAAAEALMPRYVQEGEDARIDVILLAPGRLPRHLTHVWQGD